MQSDCQGYEEILRTEMAEVRNACAKESEELVRKGRTQVGDLIQKGIHLRETGELGKAFKVLSEASSLNSQIDWVSRSLQLYNSYERSIDSHWTEVEKLTSMLEQLS